MKDNNPKKLLIKPTNKSRRSREHLTPTEIDRLIHHAGQIGRHSHRDATMILMAYRHGFRVSELISLKWSQVDLTQGQLHVSRACPICPDFYKKGTC